MDPIQVVSLFLKDPYSWPAACLIIGNYTVSDRHWADLGGKRKSRCAQSANTVAGGFLIGLYLPEDWLIFSGNRLYLRGKQVGKFNKRVWRRRG